MESGEGLANAFLHARLTSAKINLGQTERALANATRTNKDLVNEYDELAAATWYWSSSFKALAKVFAELARKHPDDPLFRPTGLRREGGQVELQYHKLFDSLVMEEAKTMPKEVPRGAPFLSFLKRKIKI
jgi:hypothetical protein